MKIHKILNNNFVIVLDENNQEQIYGGKGLAFGKKVGEIIDKDVVNKTFIMPVGEEPKVINKYIEAIAIDYFEIAMDILEIAKIKTGKKLNEGVCLAIADHLQSAVERHKAGNQMPNYILWELKKFYQVEFEVGMHAIHLVYENLGIMLSEDEAGFIATHIIDSELENSNLDQIYKTATLIKDISSIVKYFFNIDFDNDSIYYYRFITHLKFFAGRLFNDYLFNENDDDRLYEMIQKSYINSFNCTLKIEQYLIKNYNYSLSKEEKVYLTIHIENVVYKAKR